MINILSSYAVLATSLVQCEASVFLFLRVRAMESSIATVNKKLLCLFLILVQKRLTRRSVWMGCLGLDCVA
jgi:hypothetical protein